MKEENATAGAELDKTVANIKEKLNRPFGESGKEVAFDPLNLQKDIPDKKVTNGIGFLNKGKSPQYTDGDLLDPSPQTHTTPTPDAQKTSKPNALNFLGKKQEPKKTAPVETANLLDIDLISAPTTQPTVHQASHSGSTGGASIDLFDLQIQNPVSHTTTAPTYTSHSNIKTDGLLDLAFTAAATPQKQEPKKPAKPEDLFDFGL